MEPRLIREKTTLSKLTNDDIGWDYNSVPQDVEIEDIRSLADFKKHSFGTYQKTKVSTEMEKCITMEKVSKACYWAIQLLLSGVLEPLWNKLMVIASKAINIANPNLPVILANRTRQLRQQLAGKKNVLLLRNNSVIRTLICDMVSLLSLSRKRRLETLPFQLIP